MSGTHCLSVKWGERLQPGALGWDAEWICGEWLNDQHPGPLDKDPIPQACTPSPSPHVETSSQGGTDEPQSAARIDWANRHWLFRVSHPVVDC